MRNTCDKFQTHRRVKQCPLLGTQRHHQVICSQKVTKLWLSEEILIPRCATQLRPALNCLPLPASFLLLVPTRWQKCNDCSSNSEHICQTSNQSVECNTIYFVCGICEIMWGSFVCAAVLEVELTKLLDKQGTYLFDIFNPVVLPRDVSSPWILAPHSSQFVLFPCSWCFCLCPSPCCRALWSFKWILVSLITSWSSSSKRLYSNCAGPDWLHTASFIDKP